MREDEPYGRTLRIKVKQQLLVLHDQVICVDIVGGRFLPADLAVDHAALLVDGEVASMRFLYRDGRKILHVLVVAEFQLQISNYVGIFLLEHVGKDTVLRLSVLIVYTIVIYLVDEEQGQNLYTLIEQLPFTLDMGEDGLSYLDTAQLVLVHLADHVSA